MHEVSSAAWLLTGALFASIVGMGWLALAMGPHGRQLWGRPASPRDAILLRGLGAGALALSLLLCLRADHASMAALVWVMSLAGAAVLVALTLAWRAHWLALLAPWVRRVDRTTP